jgi:LacI family transcriptional regulator
MALAGFDDVPSARFMTPSLTTVHVPIRQMGIQALDWLVEAIRKGNTTSHRVNLPVELIVRESTTGYRGETPNARVTAA